MWIVGLLVLVHGPVVVLDWRGLGTKYYQWTCAGDFLGWYRRGGYERFRFWAGWCWIAFGALMICLAVAGFVNLALG
jgi:hypothetical protein